MDMWLTWLFIDTVNQQIQGAVCVGITDSAEQEGHLRGYTIRYDLTKNYHPKDNLMYIAIIGRLETKARHIIGNLIYRIYWNLPNLPSFIFGKLGKFW